MVQNWANPVGHAAPLNLLLILEQRRVHTEKSTGSNLLHRS